MIRVLTPADIPGAMRLKEAANWNQTAEDWRMVMHVEPQGCFGLECEGILAATTTAVRYGRELAWIGMVLTDPAMRGRGFARRLMEHAIEYLEGRGVAWIKLDATDMGYPLYRKLGFEDECIVERWLRPAESEAGRRAAESARTEHKLGYSHRFQNAETGGSPQFVQAVEDWLALDREGFGADRGALLAALARGESACVPGGGYAMGRPGTKAAYFGPCVAREPEAARALLEWFLMRHAGEAVFWDILTPNEAALEIARQFGFECRRKLVRMVRKGAHPERNFEHNDSVVFALAGFEYG